MSAKLIIFDCDGVLIDSEVIACRIEAEALSRAGFACDRDEIARRFIGIPSAAMYEIIAEEQGRVVPQALRQQIRERIHEAIHTDFTAIAGVHDALAKLPDPVCVASTSGLAYLRIALSHVDLHQHFEPHIFSAEQVARGKPAPDLFLFAAERMSARPENCIVIEDSAAGVTAGIAAGMRVIGFAGGGHCPPGHDETLLKHGAETVVDRMSVLPGTIEALS